MSEGLIHSYIEALGRTLRPNDDYYWHGPGLENPAKGVKVTAR
jgi:hypothetical protein